MYTFGFAFKPWTNPKSIAPREDIIAYLEETVKEEGIDRHIRFQHKLLNASWSSETTTWSLTVMTPDAAAPQLFTSSFLSLFMGYYNYENGYTPVFAGYDDFKGPIIHPQKWDEALDYTGKKIVVIGSGATAMTMIPVLAQKAEHVTMLQRSPTYVIALPDVDKTAVWLNNNLPKKTAYKINRLRNILFQRFSYAFSRSFPGAMKKALRKKLEGRMGEGFDIDKHFNPTYNPWDQRLCLVPNGDLFKAIKSKKATVITDQIEKSLTENGIQLVSGDFIPAWDIIVTATGLNAELFNSVTFQVDGEEVDFSKKVTYKSLMFDGIPNMTYAFGYT